MLICHNELVIMTVDGELLMVEANGSEFSLAVAHVEFNGGVYGFKDDFFLGLPIEWTCCCCNFFL